MGSLGVDGGNLDQLSKTSVPNPWKKRLFRGSQILLIAIQHELMGHLEWP